jgi:hypothetical protein
MAGLKPRLLINSGLILNPLFNTKLSAISLSTLKGSVKIPKTKWHWASPKVAVIQCETLEKYIGDNEEAFWPDIIRTEAEDIFIREQFRLAEERRIAALSPIEKEKHHANQRRLAENLQKAIEKHNAALTPAGKEKQLAQDRRWAVNRHKATERHLAKDRPKSETEKAQAYSRWKRGQHRELLEPREIRRLKLLRLLSETKD